MKKFNIELLDYDRERDATKVKANGKELGYVSYADVPYLTSRSIDEIFLGRVKHAIRMVFGLETSEIVIIDNYHISGGGYLTASK